MYKELEKILKNEYGKEVNIAKVSPLHDEDFEACFMVCIGNTMICRADLSLMNICKNLETATR